MITVQEWLRISDVEPIPGDFLVERSPGLLSSAIAFRQGGRWGHVSIPVSTFAKVEMHWPRGIQANLLNFRHEWAYLRLKPRHQEKLCGSLWKVRMEEHIEKRVPYDRLGILGSLVGAPNLRKDDAHYCSSLLQDLLRFSSGLHITRSQFPWPDRCYESELYDVIGWASGKQHAELNSAPEIRKQIESAIKP